MKNLIASSLFLCLSISLFGQITVESNTLPEVGDILAYLALEGFEDTTAYRMSGEDVVWTFENLEFGAEMIETFTDITTTDLADSFPTAEMLINLGPFMGAANRTTNRLNVVGVAADGFGGFGFDASVRLSDEYVIRETPLTFGTQNDDDVDVLLTLDAGLIPGLDSLNLGLPGGIDSIRVTVELERQEEVIGWGTVNLFNESYDALQVLEQTSTDFSIELGVDVFGAILWIDVTDILGMGMGLGAQETLIYKFLDNENKASLIEFTEAEVPDAQGNTTLMTTGRVSFFLATSTEDIPFNDAGLTLFPNPSTDRIVISGDNISDNFSLSIWNMQGQLVLQVSDYRLGDALDVSQLEGGYYSIRAASDDQTTTTRFYKAQ